MKPQGPVIVGAGPAGLAAALALVDSGLRPLVIDENQAAGGQIYRKEHRSVGARESGGSSRLVERFESVLDRVDYVREAAVWGVFERRLAVSGERGSYEIDASHLLLATGAYEFCPPFPGWTKPGVMTPGAAQSMVKTMGVLPGRRVVVAGSGPFLLVVAEQLARAGSEVVALVEAASLGALLPVVPALAGTPKLARQACRLVLVARKRRIPVYRGHMVVDVEGESRLSSVTLAPCDRDWEPDLNRKLQLDADVLAIGYGFVPRIQLAQLLGCQLRFQDEVGGWVPEVDATQETTVENVWVAGESAGVAGALVAELEGQIAGLAMARRFGALEERVFSSLVRHPQRRLRKLARFRAVLDRASRPRKGLFALPQPETIVCRCEELRRHEIDEAVSAGSDTLRTIKVATRLCMGPCQGRMCWPFMSRYISWKTGHPKEWSGPLSVRAPIKPVSLGDLAREPDVLEVQKRTP